MNDEVLSIPDLKQLSNRLLDEKTEHEEIVESVNEIHACFSALNKITGQEQDIKYLAAIPTASGKALGLNHAALCLFDYKRTVKFLRGMVAAIRGQQKKYPGKCIHIFYAGSGPYAPFVNLVAPLFRPDEIRFAVLEINKEAMEAGKKLIAELGFSEYVEAYYLEDAITFKIPDPEKYHIVFSETLDALLYRESYVPIIWNLLSQFSENAVLIPDNVCIKASFFEKLQEQEIIDDPVAIENIFDARSGVSPHLKKEKLPDAFPKRVIKMGTEKNIESIVLDTLVTIYENIELTRGESSLTLPLQLTIDKESYPSSLEFTYCLTPQIELKYGVS